MSGAWERAAWLGAALVLGSACASDEGGNGRQPPPQSTAGFGGSAGTSAGGGSGFGGFGSPPPVAGTGSGAGIGGGSGTGGGNSCASAEVTAARVTPTVMLVVDGSTSMEMPYGNTSRWLAIREALVGGNGVVPALEGVVKFGLAVFGTIPECPLPLGVIDPVLNNLAPINGGLPQAPPGLTTPTGPALAQIVDRLPDPTQVLDEEIGPQIIVLATDGDPNACDSFEPNPQPSIEAALAGQAKHLKMYVISVGSDASAAHLQEMANIGEGLERNASPGAMVYYPEDPAALATTLQSLIGDVVGCDVVLQGRGVVPGGECRGTVTLNGNPIECNGADGWILVDSTHIRLQGAACESFKSDPLAVLSANFPCEVLVE